MKASNLSGTADSIGHALSIVILYNSMFVTVCYFNAVEFFSWSKKGRGEGGKELMPYNMCCVSQSLK
jgi:hypothetical protein